MNVATIAHTSYGSRRNSMQHLLHSVACYDLCWRVLRGALREIPVSMSFFLSRRATDIAFTPLNFVMDMARHIPPHFQPIFKYLMLAVWFDKMRLCQIRGTSLDTLGVAGRTCSIMLLLPPDSANRGVGERRINIPSRLG